MKLLQRRRRIAWFWFVIAAIFSMFALEGFMEDRVTVTGGRHRPARAIEHAKRPRDFMAFMSLYVTVAAVGWTMTFCQFRRGTWFNPIGGARSR